MPDFYSQNRCVCSTRSHGPLLCAFCLSFHFKRHFQTNRCSIVLLLSSLSPSPRFSAALESRAGNAIIDNAIMCCLFSLAGIFIINIDH